ncbi:MAG: biotin/lipoyl-containing protein, partial [Myxococcota bacterium]
AIGVPEGGFPEALRLRILGADAPPPATEPASATMKPYDFDAAHDTLSKLTTRSISDRLLVSYALYPKVVRAYLDYRKDHGNTTVLDTETFLYGLDPDREIFVDIEPGKSLIVVRTAVSELRPDQTREVHFMLNGHPRTAVVPDRASAVDTPQRRKADPTLDHELGAPMPGTLLSVEVSVGDSIQEGQALAVVEAMKLETTVRASTRGTLAESLIKPGERVEAGDLLFVIDV